MRAAQDLVFAQMKHDVFGPLVLHLDGLRGLAPDARETLLAQSVDVRGEGAAEILARAHAAGDAETAVVCALPLRFREVGDGF